MNRLLFSIVLALFIGQTSFCIGQIDSLQHALTLSKADTNRVNILQDICSYYYNRDYQQSALYAQKALDLSKQLNFKRGQAKALLVLAQFGDDVNENLNAAKEGVKIFEQIQDEPNLGRAYNTLGTMLLNARQYDQAIVAYNQSITIHRKNNNRYMLAANYNNLGNVYKNQSQYNKAIELYRMALKVNEEINNYAWQSYNHNNLADVYQEKHDKQKALFHLSESLKAAQQSKSKPILGAIYSRLGHIHNDMRNPELAAEAYQKALDVYKELKSDVQIAGNLNNLANALKKTDQVDKAIEYYEQAAKINIATKNDHWLAINYNNIGGALHQKGKPEAAIPYFHKSLELNKKVGASYDELMNYNNLSINHRELGNYDSARYYTEIVLERAATEKFDKLLADAHLANADIADNQQDYKQAYLSLKKYKSLYLATLDSAKSNEFAQLQKLYESDALDNENKLLKQEKELAQAQLLKEKLLQTEIKNRIESERQARMLLDYENKLQLAIIDEQQLRELQILAEKEKEESEKQKLAIENQLQAELFEKQTAQSSFVRNILIISILAALIVISLIWYSNRIKQKTNQELQIQQRIVLNKNQEIQQQHDQLVSINEELSQSQEEIAAQRDHLLQLNEEVNQQKEEIETIAENLKNANERITTQSQLLEHKNLAILSSINYAARIQHAILPNAVFLADKNIPHFVVYKPKDIVSGDLYWFGQKENTTLFVTMDCTGHGVPGAIMSVMAYHALQVSLLENSFDEPASILYRMNQIIAQTLHQEQNINKDGLDASICAFNNKSKQLVFAGAKNAAFVVQIDKNNAIQSQKILKASSFSVGGNSPKKGQAVFENQYLPLDEQLKTKVYLYSDGMQDQFGGIEKRKLTAKKFRELLAQSAHMPLNEQKSHIFAFMNQYMQDGNEQQIDDFLLVCFEC